mgnify:CR=1 FL=1
MALGLVAPILSDHGSLTVGHVSAPGGLSPTGLFHGLQLWINLPTEKKRIDPQYQDLQGTDVQSPRTTSSNKASSTGLESVDDDYQVLGKFVELIDLLP